MSERNPSAFTFWIDEESFASGLRMLETEIANLYNDVEQLLDAPQMLISSVFFPIMNDGNPASGEIGPWYIQNKDLCDVVGGASTVNVSWSGLCWVDTAGTNGILSVTSTRGFSNTTPAWTALQTDSFNTAGNDIEINPLLDLNGVPDANEVYCAGFIAFAVQT